MSLHDIVEPAGTPLTGWGLVPLDTVVSRADLRDRAPPADPAAADRTPVAVTTSKWELREVG
ncbi:hypothetical protein ACFOON_15540 [Novosphingobium piscinae]|uniref:Uncharacterized protein n=1 Tax=Novosphingobium piscinae TaxID=1507448 RepID=A0A7X1FYJ4_9SPHN|nr:hypothetical protein [Novosphingobium piscinae]MBC2668687.1 hypothetical protein [Novosphingobium piscinae]